jgi:hypothetical protein
VETCRKDGRKSSPKGSSELWYTGRRIVEGKYRLILWSLNFNYVIFTTQFLSNRKGIITSAIQASTG